MLQTIYNWLQLVKATIEVWAKQRGFKNVGWLIAFVVTFIFFKSDSLIYALGFLALGIFIEKNRASLVKIYKELRESLSKNLDEELNKED